MLLEQHPHEVVERPRPAAPPPQLEIEEEPDHAALEIVRDRSILRALVRPVVLDPGVERGLRQGHPQSPRRAQQLRAALGPDLEKPLRRDQPRAPEREHLVGRGQTLHRPQESGVVLPRPVVRREGRRPEPLHVPEMEVLVRDQQQEVLVRRLLHEGKPRHEQRATPPMLEPPAALVVQMQDEEVAIAVRQPAEDGGLGVDDLDDVGDDPARIEIAASPDDQLVRHALRREGVRGVRPFRTQLERAVGQLVVILRGVHAIGKRQRRPRPPRLRHLQPHRAWLLLAPDDENRRRTRVQECMRRIDVVGAHRQLEAVQPVRHPHRPRLIRRDAPGVLVHLLDRQLAAVLGARVQAVDMPLVLADQIAPRRPHRQPDVERLRATRFERELDFDPPGLRLCDAKRVGVHGARAVYRAVRI